jgi:hypothetical protein
MSDAEDFALAELDRRGGRAAAALRSRVDTLVDPDTPARPTLTPGTPGTPGAPGAPGAGRHDDDGDRDHDGRDTPSHAHLAQVDRDDGDGRDDPGLVHLAQLDRDDRDGHGRDTPGHVHLVRPDRDGRDDHGRDDPGLVHLARVDRDGGRRRPWGRLLLAAAAVVLLAAVAAVVVGRDGTTDVARSADPPALVPGWVPDGMQLTRAVTLADAADPAAAGATITVYGDTSADDPWADTVWVAAAPGDDPGPPPTDDGGEPITIDGHPGVIREGSPELAELGARWQVLWYADGATHTVGAGDGWSREQVVAAAEAVEGDTIGHAGLPDGYVDLAHGGLGATTAYAASGDRASGLVLSYQAPAAGTEETTTLLGVIQRPGAPAEVDLLRHGFRDSGETTVRGHRAAVGRGDGMVALQWLEDGQLVTVMGTGLDEPAVARVAEELRPAGEGEVRRLLDEHPVNSFDPVPEGQEAVVEGETAAGDRWRVLVTQDAAEGMSAVTLETITADGSGSSGTEASGGGPAAGPVEVSMDQPRDADVVLYGVVAPEVASLAIEAPGRPPIEVTATEVANWERRVFGTSVPTAEATDAWLVARGADGQELGRQPLLTSDSGQETEAATTGPG